MPYASSSFPDEIQSIYAFFYSSIQCFIGTICIEQIRLFSSSITILLILFSPLSGFYDSTIPCASQCWNINSQFADCRASFCPVHSPHFLSSEKMFHTFYAHSLFADCHSSFCPVHSPHSTTLARNVANISMSFSRLWTTSSSIPIK